MSNAQKALSIFSTRAGGRGDAGWRGRPERGLAGDLLVQQVVHRVDARHGRWRLRTRDPTRRADDRVALFGDAEKPAGLKL